VPCLGRQIWDVPCRAVSEEKITKILCRAVPRHANFRCAVPCRCRQKIWNIFDPCLTPNCFPLGFKIRFKIYIRRKIFFCYFPSFIRCSAKTTWLILNLFLLDHKGKIIFIERETPAIAVSAFHFFKSLDHMIPYLKKHGIHDDLQTFARFMFQGKFSFGRPEEFNEMWKTFAKENPQLNIQCKNSHFQSNHCLTLSKI